MLLKIVIKNRVFAAKQKRRVIFLLVCRKIFRISVRLIKQISDKTISWIFDAFLYDLARRGKDGQMP